MNTSSPEFDRRIANAQWDGAILIVDFLLELGLRNHVPELTYITLLVGIIAFMALVQNNRVINSYLK